MDPLPLAMAGFLPALWLPTGHRSPFALAAEGEPEDPSEERTYDDEIQKDSDGFSAGIDGAVRW